MSYYVYSTLTRGTIYTPCPLPEAPEFQHDEQTRRILIRGGANCAKLTKIGGLHTPGCVVTMVSDKQMEALKINQHFLNHVKNGFIRYESKKIDAGKAKETLEKGDASRPVTPKDLTKFGVKEAEDPNKDKKKRLNVNSDNI